MKGLKLLKEKEGIIHKIDYRDFTLTALWDYSRLMGEDDSLLVTKRTGIFRKRERVEIILSKSSILGKLEKLSLPQRYDVYQELKDRCYNFNMGNQTAIEQILRDTDEFRRMYLTPKDEP